MNVFLSCMKVPDVDEIKIRGDDARAESYSLERMTVEQG